jgi:glucose/arabinose dehydrogenase
MSPHAVPMRRTPRLVALVAALVLVPVLPAAAAAPEPVDPAQNACPPDRVESAGFSDVPPGDSTALAIDCVAGYGIAQGRSDGSFARGAPVTRAQMALFLDRVTAYAVQASGSDAQRDASDRGFDDVAAQPRAVRDAVNRLAAEGVVQGSDADGDGRASFRPAEPVTRGQMAAFLRRTLGSISTLLTGEASDGPSSDTDYFDDDAGSVFEDDINAVADVGIAAGVSETAFRPGDAVTRQQMARFLARLLEVEVAQGVFPSRYAEGGRPLDPEPGADGPATPSAPAEVARGLRVPWGLAPLPGGGALVSERDSAQLKRVAADGAVTTIATVPGVVPGGEGGLMGLALSPTFAEDSLVYAYLTAANDNRVVRFPFSGSGIGAVTPIVTGIPKASIHNGGRIAFGPDGTLYVGTGDAADTRRSQDPSSSGGKILRVTRDGAVPGDNPDPRSPVFSLGHRNVQGLGFDEAGRLWASELGQNSFDEVNLIRGGGNYGWPVVEGRGGDPRFVDPVVTWRPEEASPSGATVAAGSFWVAALRGQRLWQVPLDGNGGVGEDRAHFVGQLGRLRAVAEVAPNVLWLLTNESDARVIEVRLS